MNRLLEKCLAGIPIKQRDVEIELYDICESTHASCNDDCPVFAVKHEIPWNETNDNCECFKNGQEMLKFLQKNGHAAKVVSQAPFFP